MKKEHSVYARWASVEQAVLLDNQVVEAEMRDIMALHNPGSGAYENAKKHRKSLCSLRAVAIFRLAIKRIAQEAAEEVRPLLVTAMRVKLEVGALRRMGSRASREVVRWSNEAARFRREALEFFASRSAPGIPAHAKEQLARMAILRDTALHTRNGTDWLKGKIILVQIKK